LLGGFFSQLGLFSSLISNLHITSESPSFGLRVNARPGP
jgi:hypothetical protein